MRLTRVGELVLVRHGETTMNCVYEKNRAPYFQNCRERENVGILQDRFEPLTKKGLAQSRRVGRDLKDLFGVPSHLFHSGFKRTIQTTEQLLRAYKQKELRQIFVKECHLVRERNAGYLRTLTQDEVKEFFPWWETYWSTTDSFSVIPLGGESIASICEGRLTQFLRGLDDLPWKGQKHKIFVVSHSRAITGMRYLLEGWDYDTVVRHLQHTNVLNCSITSYLFDNQGRPFLSLANKLVIKFSK